MSPALAALYRFLRGGKRRRVGAALIDLAQRLEGGQMRSATARDFMERYHGVRIGDYSYGSCFSPGFRPGAREPVLEIGRFTSIGPGVVVYSANHPIRELSTHPFFYEAQFGVVHVDRVRHRVLTVGNDVWIGARVLIMSGCGRIGDGSIIGAGSVVTHDVPDFAIVAGTPAKLLRYRFDEATCNALRQCRWWDHDIGELERVSQLATQEMTPEVVAAIRDSLANKGPENCTGRPTKAAAV